VQKQATTDQANCAAVASFPAKTERTRAAAIKRATKARQLRDIRRYPPRLVLAEQLGR
jgi:hypothetical protein